MVDIIQKPFGELRAGDTILVSMVVQEMDRVRDIPLARVESIDRDCEPFWIEPTDYHGFMHFIFGKRTGCAFWIEPTDYHGFIPSPVGPGSQFEVECLDGGFFVYEVIAVRGTEAFIFNVNNPARTAMTISVGILNLGRRIK